MSSLRKKNQKLRLGYYCMGNVGYSELSALDSGRLRGGLTFFKKYGLSEPFVVGGVLDA